MPTKKITLSQDINLQRALQNVSGPYISGTVSVTLGDLDIMRKDHEKAIAIAKEYESRQGMIKVVVEERMESNLYTKESPRDPGRIVKDYRYREISVNYVNLHEVQELLRQEEEDKVSKIIDGLRASEENAKVCLDQVTREFNSTTKERDTLKLELDKVKAQLTDTQKSHDELLERTDIEIEALKKDLRDQKNKQAYLQDKLNDTSIIGRLLKWFKL